MGIAYTTEHWADFGVATVGAAAALAGGGLYWLVPSTVIAMLFGIVNAWVLLVEILR